MELPSWFQSAIGQRLDQVAAWIERQPELRELRVEERAAFDAMFPDTDQANLPEYMAWEDKHHFKRAVENEHSYLQGMSDGVQLIIALLHDRVTPDTKREMQEADPNKY